jgi:hypothetical protein
MFEEYLQVRFPLEYSGLYVALTMGVKGNVHPVTDDKGPRGGVDV